MKKKLAHSRQSIIQRKQEFPSSSARFLHQSMHNYIIKTCTTTLKSLTKNELIKFLYRNLAHCIKDLAVLKNQTLIELQFRYVYYISENKSPTRFVERNFFSIEKQDLNNLIMSFCYESSIVYKNKEILNSLNKIDTFKSTINNNPNIIRALKTLIHTHKDEQHLSDLLTIIETQDFPDSLIKNILDQDKLQQCLLTISDAIKIDQLENLFKKTLKYLKNQTEYSSEYYSEEDPDYSSDSENENLFDRLENELDNEHYPIFIDNSDQIPFKKYENKITLFRKLFRSTERPTVLEVAKNCLKKKDPRYLLFLIFTSTEKIIIDDLTCLMTLAAEEQNAFAIHDILFACCFYEKTKKHSLNCSNELSLYKNLFKTAVDFVIDHINNEKTQPTPYFCITKIFQPGISILTEDESFLLQSKIFIHALKQNTAADLIADLKKHFIYTQYNFQLNNIKIAIKLINILYVYTNDIKVLKEINKQFNSFKYLVKTFKQDAIEFILQHSKKEGIKEKRRFLENNMHNHILGNKITNSSLDSYVKSLTFKDLF